MKIQAVFDNQTFIVWRKKEYCIILFCGNENCRKKKWSISTKKVYTCYD